MLNASARRAGLPVNHSLLDYINTDNSGMEDTLLNALNTKKSSSANKTVKNQYEKLETVSEQLLKKAERFAATGGESLFEQAKKSGNKDEIYSNLEEMVKKYNETVNLLQDSSDLMNLYYTKTLEQSAVADKEALSEIGITVLEDGTWKLDSDKMKKADWETLEKTLGASSKFMYKLITLSSNVCENATANAEAVSSQYNAAGKMDLSSFSKFDLWG